MFLTSHSIQSITSSSVEEFLKYCPMEDLLEVNIALWQARGSCEPSVFEIAGFCQGLADRVSSPKWSDSLENNMEVLKLLGVVKFLRFACWSVLLR